MKEGKRHGAVVYCSGGKELECGGALLVGALTKEGELAGRFRRWCEGEGQDVVREFKGRNGGVEPLYRAVGEGKTIEEKDEVELDDQLW